MLKLLCRSQLVKANARGWGVLVLFSFFFFPFLVVSLATARPFIGCPVPHHHDRAMGSGASRQRRNDAFLHLPTKAQKQDAASDAEGDRPSSSLSSRMRVIALKFGLDPREETRQVDVDGIIDAEFKARLSKIQAVSTSEIVHFA